MSKLRVTLQPTSGPPQTMWIIINMETSNLCFGVMLTYLDVSRWNCCCCCCSAEAKPNNNVISYLSQIYDIPIFLIQLNVIVVVRFYFKLPTDIYLANRHIYYFRWLCVSVIVTYASLYWSICKSICMYTSFTAITDKIFGISHGRMVTCHGAWESR